MPAADTEHNALARVWADAPPPALTKNKFKPSPRQSAARAWLDRSARFRLVRHRRSDRGLSRPYGARFRVHVANFAPLGWSQARRVACGASQRAPVLRR